YSCLPWHKIVIRWKGKFFRRNREKNQNFRFLSTLLLWNSSGVHMEVHYVSSFTLMIIILCEIQSSKTTSMKNNAEFDDKDFKIYIFDAPLCKGNIQERCNRAREQLKPHPNIEYAKYFRVENLDHL